MKDLALPSKVAQCLGDYANKPGGKCYERVNVGTQRRGRQRKAFPMAVSVTILQGLDFSKLYPDGSQPGKQRTEAGYLMLVQGRQGK